MKKVLCNKDGKFLSIHDGDCTLTELNDGDCLTHEDGTIVIYKEGDSYYYIDWNRFTICKTVEADSESDNIRYKNLNYFQTKEEADTKLFAVKSVLND